ncbi:MAG: type I methionyl aminopeptidase, partial [Actinobacteria bacterium]|nr:type I methionyl aminopeptidase [Actinomycetota bacterium]
MIICKSEDEIRLMREAGRIVAKVFLKIEEIIKPGITTGYIDKIVEEVITGEKAVPAFKGYVGKVGKKPFPNSACISIDEQVVHGIPGKRVIKDGELVSIDIGVKINGFYGDATRTYKVGNVSKIAERLWNATKEALDKSIELCVVGNRLSDISSVIENRAMMDGFSVVKDFVGHGIGREMHEDPQILNYGPPGQGPVLKQGMVLAIEPMFNQGSSDVEILSDLWTVVTMDS